MQTSMNETWNLETNGAYDKETLLATIINTGGTFEPIYTNPEYFKYMCDFWFKKHKETFQHWTAVLESEYEPLWDRNGFETIDDEHNETGTLSTATAGNRTDSGTRTSTEVMADDTTYSKSGTEDIDLDETYSKSGKEIMDDDTTTHSSTTTSQQHTESSQSSTENKVSAYDEDDYSKNTISTTSGSMSSTDSGTNTTSGTGTDDRTTTTTENGTSGANTDRDWTEHGSGTDDRTTTFNETNGLTAATTGTVDTDTSGHKTYAHQLHSWGNWGISQTSQKLLESELNVRKWNLYDHAAHLFLHEMCVRVF